MPPYRIRNIAWLIDEPEVSAGITRKLKNNRVAYGDVGRAAVRSTAVDTMKKPI